MPTAQLVGTICKNCRQIAVLALVIIGGTHIGYCLQLQVPFKAQVPPGTWKQTNNCGQTAVAMVTAFYNNSAPTEQSIKNIDDFLFSRFGDPVNGYNGSPTNTSKLAAVGKEFSNLPQSFAFSGWTTSDLQQELQFGHPPIIAVWTNMVDGTNPLSCVQCSAPR